ncbi:hypothetical protein [Micromonospora parastrephiae]|uniref:hypothetical protein n=1 Tax=Micromonospora parastrephiae TaxID=2806101 RepID=UPI001EE4E342|nr:hypothetical protein [Micromonospora parastrephiae]
MSEVLADHPVVQYPSVTSMEFKRDRTPSGRPVPKGPSGNTFSEPVWLPSNTTTRVREFVRVATDANAR